jgi:hypothetical protein
MNCRFWGHDFLAPYKAQPREAEQGLDDHQGHLFKNGRACTGGINPGADSTNGKL